MDGIPRLATGSPLREQVHQVLEDLIIHRVLEPGARLAEEELARSLGVSRNPVREALATLEREGWIEVGHRQGARVRVPRAAEAEQTFEVRRILETEAAALAAKRISDAQLTQLSTLLREGEEALQSGDPARLVDCNAGFHRFVGEASGNVILADMLQRLEKRIMWLFSAVASGRGEESWREHAELSRHLHERNPQAAAAVMADHTAATRAAYMASQEAQAEVG